MDELVENNSISSPDEALTLPLDYRALKKLGLEAIIRFGSDKWTDYNEHDPGITILELLVYALTDLAYRTDFPIEDIIAQQQLSAEQLAQSQFYTAREILSSNPLSLLDFRKLIIDLKGVQNAWVHPWEHSFEPTRGLLEILIDPDDEIKSQQDKDELVERVSDTYHQHRNICQDLGPIQLREPLEIFFDIQLTLDPKRVVEEVIAQLLLELDTYLANAVQFLSFEESMELFEGDINQVFNGPALVHGFLPDQALKPIIEELRSVDLIPILSKIPGVVKIQELKFRTSLDELGPFKFLEKETQWVYQKKIPSNLKPVLAPIEAHKLVIKRGDNFYKWILGTVKTELKNLRNRQRQPKLSAAARDVPIPMGQYRDLSAYFPLQEDFPKVYGLDPHGPPPGADAERLAKIKQLQAYLLIFDQIMANYLAQLAHLGELFSWSPDIKRTYFFQGLESSIDNLSELLSGVNPETDPITKKKNSGTQEKAKQALSQYHQQLATFREDQKTFLQRRNRFLDHLLSRFGRSLTGFTQQLEKADDGFETAFERQEQTSIQTKQNILGNYANLSAQRGKAFNIFSKKEDFSTQYSGLRRWVETIFDMEPESLDTFRFNERFIEDAYDPSQPDNNQLGEYIFVTDDNSPIDLKELMRIGIHAENYRVDYPKKDSSGQTPSYSLSLFKLEDITRKSNVYRLTRTFETAEQCLAAIEELVKLFQTYQRSSERIYIIEHFLLRPLPEEKFFGLQLLDANGDVWLQTNSWYSRNELAELEEMVKEQYAYFELLPPPAQPAQPAQPTTPKPQEEPATTAANTPDPLPVFSFSIVSATEGKYQVKLSYGRGNQPVVMQSAATFNTVQEAQNAIFWWLKSVAKFLFSIEPNEAGKFQLFMQFGVPEKYYPFIATQVFDKQSDAEAAIHQWKQKPALFNFSTYSPQANTYGVQLNYETTDISLSFQSIDLWDTEQEARQVTAALKDWREQDPDSSGSFFNQQELWKPLLRPWPWDNTLAADPAYSAVYQDPFSFVFTVVIPDWPTRFQQKAFKEALLQVLNAEAPAHLWMNILWLDKAGFQRFRFLYGNWWRAFSQQESSAFVYRKALMDFIMERSFKTETPPTHG